MKWIAWFAAGLAAVVALIGLKVEPARSETPKTARPTANSAAKPTAKIDDKFADLRGEWLRAGAGFACKVKPPEGWPSGKALPANIVARACSFLGPFAVGDDPQTVSRVLGAPQRSLPQPKGATGLVYFLGEAGRYPYFVETVLKNRIVALQVSGPEAAKGYGFNHVDLGSPITVVLQYFGQPAHIGPSGIKGTELWSYGSSPFSFEITDDHVTSIRVGLLD